MNIVVLIGTYQCNQYFDIQLKSILDSDKEGLITSIVISDDSYDDSINIYLDKYDDGRIKLISGPKKNSAKINYLKTVDNLDFDWVFFSDQDDIWCADKFKCFFDFITNLKEPEQPHIIFSDASLVDENDTMLASSFFKYAGLSQDILLSDDILFSNCVQGASLCMNKSMALILRKTLSDPRAYKDIAMHDWWIAILARYTGHVHFIDKSLLCYRQHSANLVGAKKKGIVNFLRHFNLYRSNLILTRRQYLFWCYISDLLDFKFNKNNLNLSLKSKIKKSISKFFM